MEESEREGKRNEAPQLKFLATPLGQTHEGIFAVGQMWTYSVVCIKDT